MLLKSISSKIVVVMVGGLLLVGLSGMYGFNAARGGLDNLQHVLEGPVQRAEKTLAMQTDFKEQVQEWKNVLLRGHDAKNLDKYWGQFIGKEREVRDGARELSTSVVDPKARDLLGRFLAAHEEMGVKYREGLEAFKSSGFDHKAGDAAVKGIDRAPTDLLTEAVKLMVDAANAEVNRAQRGTRTSLDASMLTMFVFGVLACVVCVLLLRRMVVRPILEASRVASAVAGGDLTVETKAESRDEIGQLLESLGRMRDDLAQAVGNIRRAAEGVSSAAGEIARGNADLSNRTQQQASSLEETSSSMEEFTSTVKQNAGNAAQANQLVAGASDVAMRGGEAVRGVVSTMTGITESSKKISDIIGVIDGIAFQTNILALNAAVEAARAGEQGRGFAVVASEVRSLAHRSAEAAKQIKTLIQESVGRVDAGTRQVESAGKTMDELLAAVKRVTDIMGEIAAASTEQLSGIEQVGSAIAQMDQVVQQNAALVEEAAAATENLAHQGESLVDSVARFKVNTIELGAHGLHAAPAVVPPRAAEPIALRKAPALARATAPSRTQGGARAARLAGGEATREHGAQSAARADAAGGDWKEI